MKTSFQNQNISPGSKDGHGDEQLTRLLAVPALTYAPVFRHISAIISGCSGGRAKFLRPLVNDFRCDLFYVVSCQRDSRVLMRYDVYRFSSRRKAGGTRM